MSKICEVCGKAPVAGRSISHSHRVSNRTFRPNVQKVTIKDANGVVTVTPHDPMNMGGWSAVIVDGENAGQLFFRSGFTMYELPQSLLVDYASGTVTLEATG